LLSLAACGHARGKQQKKYLRSKGFLACKDARGSEEIFNLALINTSQSNVFLFLQGRPRQRRDL
jgi:hypothetical protein